MNPRTPFVVAIAACGLALGLLASFAASADTELTTVRFDPGSAAPRAGRVEAGEGRYWDAHGARCARTWAACGAAVADEASAADAGAADAGAADAGLAAPRPKRGAGEYVDLGR